MWQGDDSSRRHGPQRMQPCDLLHFLATQVTDQRLAHCRRLWRDAPTVPDVHLDEAWRLDPLYVHRVAVIENRKVRSEARRFDELSEMRQRELAQGHALHRLTAKAQNPDPERVLPAFRIASHVATCD